MASKQQSFKLGVIIEFKCAFVAAEYLSLTQIAVLKAKGTLSQKRM